LELTQMDRCLNIMPLFHVHGASVVCTPGFYVAEVLDWMKEFQPTWFTAVPAIHQAILKRVAVAGGIPKPSRLRFIRSCSSALSPKLMAEMERIFDLPVPNGEQSLAPAKAQARVGWCRSGSGDGNNGRHRAASLGWEHW